MPAVAVLKFKKKKKKSISLLKFYVFILAALGLHCCTRAFSSCGHQELVFAAVLGLPIVVASLVAEHRLYEHRLSCSAACGIFPDQGSNWSSLHWRVDS